MPPWCVFRTGPAKRRDRDEIRRTGGACLRCRRSGRSGIGTTLTSATFNGLIAGGANVGNAATLQPDPSLVAGMPPLVTAHLAGAWIVPALIPFTRPMHMFALPLGYFVRPMQRVGWARRA